MRIMEAVWSNRNRMIDSKSCLNILIGILFYTCRANGQLEINLPSAGNYNEATEMNCTDPSFNIANGYTWFKDNLKIYDTVNGDATSTGKYTSTHGTGFFTLVITNTALDDNGEYKCEYNFQNKKNTLEIQAKGTGEGKVDGVLEITLNKFYPNITTVLSVVGNGITFPGTQRIAADGDFFTIVWTSNSDIDRSNVQNGCDVTVQSVTMYDIHVNVKASSTMPTTTTTTTLTSSASTAPTSTSTTPTSTYTTTTSVSEFTATTHTTTSATAISTTSTTSLITKAKSETTTASADSSKSENVVIIVASVVGGLLVVGIVITITLMLLSQWKRRKHVSGGIHTNEENRNNKQFQRSKFPSSVGYSNDGYTFNGKSSGFKQNPHFVRLSNRPVTYQYQPWNGNYRPNPYSLHPYIYSGFTDGDQYSGRYVGQDRRVNEAPNYFSSCNLMPHYYSHPCNPHRSNSRMPVRETLQTDDQNNVVSDYSMYW